MTSFSKGVALAFAAALCATAAQAQDEGLASSKQQLAALQRQEAALRERIAQYQLDALVARIDREPAVSLVAARKRPVRLMASAGRD